MPKVPVSVRRAIRLRVKEIAVRDEAAMKVSDLDSQHIVPWFVDNLKGYSGEDRKITTALEDGAGTVTSTLVTPGSDVIDLDELKESIGVRLFNELHTEVPAHLVFDQDKFEAAVKLGRISPAVAGRVMRRKETAPYVKHTVKGGK